jgi:hypothetical protein
MQQNLVCIGSLVAAAIWVGTRGREGEREEREGGRKGFGWLVPVLV